MKVEINNENKAKFFAQYWGQEIVKNIHGLPDQEPNGVGGYLINNSQELNMSYLELKPLSSISDEDTIKLGFKSSEEFVYWVCEQPKIVNHLRDDLRFLGYAYEWMGLSVEEMVEAGWIKLTES